MLPTSRTTRIAAMRWPFPLIVAGVLACNSERPPPPNPSLVVAEMLELSALAWNRGDLDGFMSDYLADTATTFVSRGRAQHGFDWIRTNYAPSFAPGAQRDSLRFEDAEARALGSDFMLATARWVLYRGDSVTASGPFTLVLRRHNGDWRIIHDHSSSDPN